MTDKSKEVKKEEQRTKTTWQDEVLQKDSEGKKTAKVANTPETQSKVTDGLEKSYEPKDLVKAITGKKNFSNIQVDKAMRLVTIDMGEHGETSKQRHEFLKETQKVLRANRLDDYRLYQVHKGHKYFSTL